GIDENVMIRDFKYLNNELDDELIKSLNSMQDKYVFKEEYKITISEVNKCLKEILCVFKDR
ncbi:MAG: hypothetical protein MJ245_03575, partial [Clostridia bacterium]|nr:hypothetical protein [Clostridia bacterium]